MQEKLPAGLFPGRTRYELGKRRFDAFQCRISPTLDDQAAERIDVAVPEREVVVHQPVE